MKVSPLNRGPLPMLSLEWLCDVLFIVGRREASQFPAVVFFTSVPLTYSAEPVPRAEAESKNVPEAASVAGAVIAASARSGKFFDARLLRGQSCPGEGRGGRQTARTDYRHPRPQWFDDCFPGPWGPRRVRTPADDGSRGIGQWALVVFYLKFAKAEAVAVELDRILSGGGADSKVRP